MENKFPERLAELREERKLSQNELNRALGLGSGPTISRWERGLQSPSVEYIIMLCEFFGCTADYLLGLKHE